MTTRAYLKMAAVIFSLSIVSQLLSIVLEPERLAAAHGLFTFLSIRQFLFVTAIFETGILCALLAKNVPTNSKAYIVYTVAVLFTCYHGWMVSKGVSGCGCFGIFPIKALNRALDYFTYGLLLLLLVGSGVVIARETLKANAPVKGI